jgi:type IV pilus assembly protein PilA
LAGGAVILVPIFAVLSVYGVRKYIQNAKNTEARNVLAQIALDATKTYDAKRGFCPSASYPVPFDAKYVRGAKYQSAPADWTLDAPGNAGFACLGFSIDQPQYYQYTYTSNGRSDFTATARGDLNGDGVLSTFTLRGKAGPGGQVSIAPQIEEQAPGE